MPDLSLKSPEAERPLRLARRILSTNALNAAAWTIPVDRSSHQPPEPGASFTGTPWGVLL